jgi:hypothetical protein
MSLFFPIWLYLNRGLKSIAVQQSSVTYAFLVKTWTYLPCFLLLFAQNVLHWATRSCIDVQVGFGKWCNVMLYGPPKTAVLKVALLDNEEACRQLTNEAEVMRIAEARGLAGTVVPRRLDCGLDAQVS